jgi:hypothetical protein
MKEHVELNIENENSVYDVHEIEGGSEIDANLKKVEEKLKDFNFSKEEFHTGMLLQITTAHFNRIDQLLQSGKEIEPYLRSLIHLSFFAELKSILTSLKLSNTSSNLKNISNPK